MARKQKKQSQTNDLVIRWIDGNGASWNVEFEMKTVANVARISGFKIHAMSSKTHLTANHLREIPFGQLSEQFLVKARRSLPRSQAETLPSSVGAGRTSSLAQLRRVAELYVQASQQHENIQTFIAEALDVSSATAARRIRAARKSGLLPPRKSRN